MCNLTWQKLVYDLKSISVEAIKELHINNCIQTEWETYIYTYSLNNTF